MKSQLHLALCRPACNVVSGKVSVQEHEYCSLLLTPQNNKSGWLEIGERRNSCLSFVVEKGGDVVSLGLSGGRCIKHSNADTLFETKNILRLPI